MSRLRKFVAAHRRYVVITAFVIMAGWLLADRWPLRNTANADAGRKVVSIYADGKKQMVNTDLPTVRDALSKAGVALTPGDVVEPGLNEQVPDGFYNVNVYRAQPYRVVDGTRKVNVRSAARSPRLIAQEAGVEVYAQDRVELAPMDSMAEAGTVGQDIIIDRATAVTVVMDGKAIQLRTQGSTVGDLLKDNGIQVATSDKVSPGIDTKIQANLRVTLSRVRVNVETKDEVVERPVEQVEDPTQMRGYKKVQKEGKDGSRRTTYLVTYHNGKPTQKKELKTQVLAKAEARIEVVGTKMEFASDAIQLGHDMAAARGWTGANWDALYKLWMKESGWNPNSVNNGSGACGIPQAYPCSKIKDKSAAGQIKWGLDYIKGRYGTPSAAWAHFLRYNSY